jgi:uncharacterized protein YjbI with pentapeptide repeats
MGVITYPLFIIYPIYHAQTKEVLFTTLIGAAESDDESYKKRLAVLWAMGNGYSLNYAELSGVDLTGLDLLGLNMSYADMTKAICVNTIFTFVDLRGVNFLNANLSKAVLRNVDFTDANFKGADMRGAMLYDNILFQPTYNRLEGRLIESPPKDWASLAKDFALKKGQE